ncbi:hypothetical protein AL036_00650 [Salipiger aestuarii]|uniref:5-bromo-4-chloroindolyl phosphate hydrolysis protein n=1 Tax=Salipiger aestuarii TaxID=568098 RepID=A0A327YLX4_9RHOB|nr:hypothetical protein [Salipiger aestuarii]KAA8610426.1 hypothetical protein AL036_00650 [Salipiger aestuarii]KAA8616442.1 hypothetical protein AL037_00645 [Salipiger aestuarii]KAB2543462.1 hypothetical protein AL035_01340 [Salipiger aestuarii]RAK21973.1 hypothetical protein ATI53_1003129 [Salipiger aestuarii]
MTKTPANKSSKGMTTGLATDMAWDVAKGMSRARMAPNDDSLGPLDSALGVLFLASFPVFLLLFQGRGVAVFTAILLLALFLVALRLIHRGQQICNAYDRAGSARAPKVPRKAVGAALIGLMVALLAGHHFDALYAPALLGLLATALGIAAFGMDPRKDKGEPGALRATDDPVDLHRLQPSTSETLMRIDAKFEELATEIANLGDAEVTRRFEALHMGVMGLIRALGEDGAGMRRLRKPVTTLVEMIRRENASLQVAWSTGDRFRARRRYLAHLTAIGEAFEVCARKSGAKTGRDAFELQADVLWNRMPRDRVA